MLDSREYYCKILNIFKFNKFDPETEMFRVFLCNKFKMLDGYNSISNTKIALSVVIVIYKYLKSNNKEMNKILLIIMACAVVFNLSAQKLSEQIFKIKYELLIDGYSQDDNKDLTNDNIEQFREQYKRLTEGLKEIEMFRYEVLTVGNIFSDKELKSLDKENQVDELEDILKRNSDELKLFLGKHHEYGIGKEECLKNYSNLKHCIDRKDYETAFISWREMFKD